MSFDYDLKSNFVAMISNHSQSQSKLQLDKETGRMVLPMVDRLRNLPCAFHPSQVTIYSIQDDKKFRMLII